MSAYPISQHLDNISQVIEQNGQAILVAPPGTGKSTVLPLSFLQSPWLKDQQIWLLEPRRLAAKQVALRLAQQLGETLNQSIGLITGDGAQVSAANKIVVMTEGVLTQKLIEDNEINACAMVIFDEFHERNLATDLNLALVQQCRDIVREDLKCLVMSATLEIQSLEQVMKAPVIEVNSQSHELDISYQIKQPQERLEEQIVRACRNISSAQGDTLIFLPGLPEIRRVERTLIESGTPEEQICILHSSASPKQQQAVFKQVDHNKVILASDIAKTSLTIPSITSVIDCGLERMARYNPNTGLDELITVEASQASMIQRAGRAGRVRSGRVIRLCSKEQFERRPAFSTIAIEQEDLTQFALALAAWGSTDYSEYMLLNQPNLRNYEQALTLLENIDAIDEQQRITAHGVEISHIATHPRLAHMLIHFSDCHETLPLACAAAALLSEGDFFISNEFNSDLSLRIELIAESLRYQTTGANNLGRINKGKLSRVIKRYQQLIKRFSINEKNNLDWPMEKLGVVLAQAYPDRIAQKRGHGFRLQNGMGVNMHRQDSAKSESFMVVASINSSAHGNDRFIQLAIPISQHHIIEAFEHHFKVEASFTMKQNLLKTRQRKFGELVLSSETVEAGVLEFQEYLVQEIETKGFAFLNLNEKQQRLLNKLRLAHRLLPDDYPNFDDDILIETLDSWLLPFVADNHLNNIDYSNAFLSRMDWPMQQALQKDLPDEFVLPSGRKAKIIYDGETAIIKAKLQECFGLQGSHAVARNTLILEFHLLDPAQRPLAQTKDLDFFWQEVYPQVRKENRGRYAKHPWPEDPLNAIASHKTKRHM